MIQQDWKRFAQLMTTTAEYYRVKPWTMSAMMMAFSLLRDLTIEQVELAISRHACGLDGNTARYCPNAADLRLALTGTPEQRAVIAWRTVVDALHKYTGTRSVRFSDPCIHFALSNIGGWTGLSMATTDQEPRFCRAYMVAVSRMVSWDEVPDHLSGYAEQRRYAGWSSEQIVTVQTDRSSMQRLPKLTISENNNSDIPQ